MPPMTPEQTKRYRAHMRQSCRNNPKALALFTDEVEHTDPEIPKDAKPRLNSQNQRVLARLKTGSATNTQLEKVSGSKRVNSRVADVRRYLKKTTGQTVTTSVIDSKAGIYRYEIK